MIEKFTKIQTLTFSIKTAAKVLGLAEPSARVQCHRYVQRGLLTRLKRDVYILSEKWRNLSKEEIFMLANRLQVPSYISFTTALSFYEITTQIQQNFFESAALVRTKDISVKDRVFKYQKIQPKLYNGFIKESDFFIAVPEKAFLDSIYLMSLGRYRLDVSSLDWKKFNIKTLDKLSRTFPVSVRKMVEKYAAAS